ncbi:12536_t:CDS:2, partial [Racocetra fulgida]
VDLNELFDKPNARIFRVYGDVIQLSNTLEIPHLDGSGIILIAARRVEINPGCQIIVNYKKFFRIVIYTEEMTSELEIIAKNQLKNDDSSKFVINKLKDDKCVGKLLTIRDGKSPEYKDIHVFDNNIFEERRNNEISFVPLLDKQFYRNGINEFMETVKFYEHKYKQFLDKSDKIDQMKLESEFSLENINDETELHDHLKKNEYERYDSAYKLVKKIKDELKEKQNVVNNACEHFKEEIEKWKDQKIYEEQMNVLIAVFNLAIRIGTIVIRPDGIVNIIESIEKTSISVQDALNAGDKVKAFIDENKDLKDNLNDIKDKIETIQKIEEDLKNNCNKAKDLNNSVITEQKRIESLD